MGAHLPARMLNDKGSEMPARGTMVSGPQAKELEASTGIMGCPDGVSDAPAGGFEDRFCQIQERSRGLRGQAEQFHGQDAKPSAAVATSPAPETLFSQHCQKCHGADGTGSVARHLQPEIPDFTSARWQRGRTHAELLASVLDGKGSDMPAFRPKISLENAHALVAEARRFGVPPAQQGATERAKGGDEPPDGEGAFLPKLIGWLGRFHPASVHFPIALLLAAAVAELLLLVTDRLVYDAASRVCLWFGAPGTVLAATLGWFAAGDRGRGGNGLLTAHQWLGTSTVVLAGLALLLSELSRRSDRLARIGFRLLLWLTALLLLANGFLGGALTHGLTHYAWPS
jgi:uncharacterized membrane protein/mono/diheme cytochrome c family protein